MSTISSRLVRALTVSLVLLTCDLSFLPNPVLAGDSTWVNSRKTPESKLVTQSQQLNWPAHEVPVNGFEGHGALAARNGGGTGAEGSFLDSILALPRVFISLADSIIPDSDRDSAGRNERLQENGTPRDQASRARALLPKGLLDFAVIRDGDVIGHHRVAFRQVGPTTIVDVEAKIEITRFSLTVYRFLHHGRETWRGGRLIAFKTTTNDDGDQLTVEASLDGDGDFNVLYADKVLVAPGKSIPSSLWHLGILRARTDDRLLHTITGRLLPITVTELGSREIETASGPVAAEGYIVDSQPDFHRELWYDETGLLVAAGLTGADGSSVELVRQSPVSARAAEQARLLNADPVTE